MVYSLSNLLHTRKIPLRNTCGDIYETTKQIKNHKRFLDSGRENVHNEYRPVRDSD